VKRGLFLLRVEEARWKDGERCLGEPPPSEREAMPDAMSWEAERRMRRRVAEGRVGGGLGLLRSFLVGVVVSLLFE
jgi:hypothetical protein